jgi:tetraacyldisaccharide 4'-kinase
MIKRIFTFSLAAVYDQLTRARNRLYDRRILPVYRSTLPVISIGNLTVGGNAKTPLCIFLAKELTKRCAKPVILSRGYAGAIPGPYHVLKADSAHIVGDEACLISRYHDIDVVIARDRVAGAKFIEKHKLGTIIILDDGLQHRRLARDVEIISINIGTPESIKAFAQGNILPAGLFRENRDAGLQRADIVVLAQRRPKSDLAHQDQEVVNLVPDRVQLFRSFLKPEGVFSLEDGKLLAPCAVVAFCGIANPNNFYMTLQAMGYELKATESFVDHHYFRAAEIERLRERNKDLALVCTEKDAVKVTQAQAQRVHVLRAQLEIEPQNKLVDQILSMVKDHNPDKAMF